MLFHTVFAKYPFVNSVLLAHVLRYSGEGVKLTYDFNDINRDGVDELLVGVGNGLGAIYTYDKAKKTPVNIHFQSTMERGDMSVYDNGVILSTGAGGAALHYYEFGRISAEGNTFELIESIEEEYLNEGEAPIYRNAITNETLEYKSSEEFMNKYLSGANKIEMNPIEL